MFEPESDDMRTIKALPLWQAFLTAVIAPIIIAFVFAMLGAQKDPLLLQIELILVAIAFCLTGILARSKLLGLLSVVAAPISWVVLFFASSQTNGWFVNPFGLLSELAGPLTSIAQSDILPPEIVSYINPLIQVAMIVDLIILEFMALFLGFFLSTLATGFWTKQGELSILSVITKPIAAIFTIFILITVPFVYHGIANFMDGGVSLVAGTAEFMTIFGGELDGMGGTGAQDEGLPIDLSDPEVIEELRAAAVRAEAWFRRSQYKFDHVQGNFYTSILLGFLPEEVSGLNMRKIDKLLDISEILADVSSAVPDLLLGYNSLVDGFDRTFTVLSTTDLGGGFGGSTTGIEADYVEDFNIGLKNITDAVYYFNKSKPDVLRALGNAKGIISEVFLDPTGDFGDIVKFVDQAQIGYGIILEVALGAIDFLNATYKTTLAVTDLGDSDFEGAHDWMDGAATDLTKANFTLRAIDTTGLDKESELPFWGTVEIIKDMTELLTYFARAAANSTECYSKIENVIDTIENLDFKGDEVLDYDWIILSTNVEEVDTVFQGASSNIAMATSLSETYTTKSYGDMIDGSLKPMLNDFSSMLNQFSSNITEIGHLIKGLTHTIYSMEHFTTGFKLFNNSYVQAYEAADNASHFFSIFSTDPNVTKCQVLMDSAVENASTGHTEIGKTKVIPRTVKDTWQLLLYSPGPPDPPSHENLEYTKTSQPESLPTSIAGLAKSISNTIDLLILAAGFGEEENDLIQALFDAMDEVGMNEIFG